MDLSGLKHVILSGITFWTLGLNAQTFCVTGDECARNRAAQPATLITVDSGTYLITRISHGELPGHMIELIANDVRLGLSLFQLKETDARAVDLQWADTSIWNSSRHFFPFEYHDPWFQSWATDDSVTEWNAGITRHPDVRQIGSPIWHGDDFIGVQGNEWIMVLPASPSRTVRDVDLPLARNVTATFIPLVITRNLIRRWISQRLWQISPAEVLQKSLGQQTWRVDHSVISEDCKFGKKNLAPVKGGVGGSQPGGVGGVHPGGVGGAQPGGVGGTTEDTFGCKLTITESSTLPLGHVLEVYTRNGSKDVDIQPPANINDLIDRANTGWTVLVEPGEPHTPLQSAAMETIKAVREFSEFEQGDPKVLRKLFAWALILASDHPRDLQAGDLRDAIVEFSKLASANLGGIDVRSGQPDSKWQDRSQRVMTAAENLQNQLEISK